MRENYFILTGIDPNEDPARLEQKLQQFKDEQARNATHPSAQTKLRARQNLDQFDAIAECLRNPVSRRAEAVHARTILLKQKSEQFRLADDLIAVLGARGFLTDDDVQEILRQLKATQLTESEIRSRIQLPIRPRAVPPTIKPPPPLLDPSLAKAIEGLLEVLNCASLYAFLNLQETVSTDLLCTRARVIQERERNNSNKGAQVDATVDLSAKCILIFGSEEMRQKYDRTRAEAKLRILEPLIKATAAAASKLKPARVDESTFRQLLIKARGTGASQEDSTRFLQSRFQKLNVEVMLAASTPENALIRCYCGLVNPYSAKVCSSCGTALRSNCPGCRKENTTETVYCACGFPIGHRGLLERLLSDLERLLANRQLAEARACMDEAAKLWPAGSELKSPAESLQKLEKEQSELLNTLEQQLQNGRAVVARETLLTLHQRFPSCPKLTALDSAVKQSEQQFSRFTQHKDRFQVLMNKGQLAEARQELEEARNVLPYAADLQILATDLQKQESDQSELLKSLDTLIANGQAESARETLLTLRQRFPGSPKLTELESAVKQSEHQFSVFTRQIQLAQTLVSAGRLVEARKNVEDARDLLPRAADLTRVDTQLKQLEDECARLQAGFFAACSNGQPAQARQTLAEISGKFLTYAGQQQVESRGQELERQEQQFRQHLENFQRRIESGQLQDARTNLEKARSIRANAAELPPLFETLRGLDETSRKLLDTLDSQLKDRQLLAARATLEAFSRQFSSHPQLDRSRQLLETAEKPVQQIRSQLSGLAAEQQSDTAPALLQTLVSLCVDDDEAKQRLNQIPPPAPAGLEAKVLAGGTVECRLELPKTLQRNLRFVVVVNTLHRPVSATDGRVITEEYRAPAVTDQRPELGVPLYYAAFTFRGDVCSTLPACARPLLLPCEITELRTASGDEQITLTWKLPDGAERSRVLRQEGDPPATGEGLEVPAQRNTCIDRGLQNNVRCGYRVCAGFIDPADGRQWIWSPGQTCEATPHPEARPVLDLQLKRSGTTGVVAAWTPPQYGDVEIRYVCDALPKGCTPGAVLPLTTIRAWGEGAERKGPGRALLTFPHQGRWFCIPLTIADSSALVGKIRSVVRIDPVSNPTAEVLTIEGRPRIRLRWSWQAGAHRACVVSHRDHCPAAPDESNTERVEITAAEYDRIGYLEIEPKSAGLFYVTVFALTAQGDASAGVPLPQPVEVRAPVTVKYEIMVYRSVLPRRIRAVTLQLDLSAGPVRLPDLILVGRADHMPTQAEDGTRILTVHFDKPLAAGLSEVEVPQEWWGKKLYCRLFVGDSAAAGRVRLIPAEKSKVSLHQ